MIKFVQAICSLLDNGETAAMGTILTHVGSTPRTAGTKMLIRSDGGIVGTIGGGMVEAEVQKAGSEIIKTARGRIVDFDLTGADVDKMDLICGGKLTVLMECLEPNPADREFFSSLLTELQSRRKSYFVTVLGPTDEDAGPVARYLIPKDGAASGDSACPAHWSAKITEALGRQRHPVILTIDGQRVLAEQTFVPGTVFLFGAVMCRNRSRRLRAKWGSEPSCSTTGRNSQIETDSQPRMKSLYYRLFMIQWRSSI